jgi:hypothetical protein
MTVVLALGIHFVITLPMLLKFIGKVNPWRHFRAMSSALLTAFSVVLLPVSSGNANSKINPVKIAVIPHHHAPNVEDGRAAWLQRSFRWALRQQKRIQVLPLAQVNQLLLSKQTISSKDLARARVLRTNLYKAKKLYQELP